MERTKIIGVVLLLVVALGFLGVSVQSMRQPEETEPGLIPAAKAPPAPDFELPEVATGRTVRLSEQARARPVLLTFWATFCPPCRLELPYVQQLSKKYAGRVAIYGINSSDSPERIAAFAKANGLSFPMLSDARGAAAVKYSVDAIPRLYLVDRRGSVRVVSLGFSDEEMGVEIPKALDSLLREQ